MEDGTTTTYINTTDPTKKLRLSLVNLTTSTTRILTIPDFNTTLVGSDNVQTITNKI